MPGVFKCAAAMAVSVVLLLLASHARADTFIYLDRGAGATRLITPAPGYADGHREPLRPGARLSYFDNGSFVYIDLVGPSGAPFVPGNYEDATRAAFRAPRARLPRRDGRVD